MHGCIYLPAQFYSYALESDPAPAVDLELDFGPLKLIGADVALEREGWVEVALYWQAQAPVPDTYRPSIALGPTSC